MLDAALKNLSILPPEQVKKLATEFALWLLNDSAACKFIYENSPSTEAVSESEKIARVAADFLYYSYPCVFGSTAGPRGGYGGSMVTTFQVHALVFEGPQRYALQYCAGVTQITRKFLEGAWQKNG